MLRLFKLILILAAMLGVAIVAYAYIGDLSPEQTEVDEPVDLDAN